MTGKLTRRASKAGGKAGLTIAGKIKAARIEAGVSQSTLAEALGVSFQQVQKYERGTNRVSSDRLQLIAHTLHKPITYFFMKSPPPSPVDADILTPIIQWMDSGDAARQILVRLPMLKRDDAVIVAAMIERLTSGP